MSEPDAQRTALTYAGAGVDIAAAQRFVERIRDITRSTHRPEVLAGVGPFAGLFQLGSYREPVLVSSTDSVGTKVKIASLLGRFDTLGIDLVNQNVNDVITAGAEPLFFLDYIASATLNVDEKTALVQGVATACREAGCALIGGETADMPDVYAPGDFDLVGFVVGVVERDAIIDGSSIAEGDALLALPSNGLHTNGYSLARRAFGVGIGGDPSEERARLERHEPELAPEAHPPAAEATTLGDALLRPHSQYWPALRPALPKLKGIAHITQGGLEENVSRVLPSTGSGQGPAIGARFDRSAWDVPPIFGLLQREGNVADDEMWRTYNMGLGLVFAVAPSDVAAVRAVLPDALVVGEVVRAEGDVRVIID